MRLRRFRAPSSATVLGLVAVVRLGAALGGEARAGGRAARAGAGRTYRFDGFRLGDRFSRVMTRAPWSPICDVDPIDHRRRSGVFYGAKPCRRRVFPERTTVILYLASFLVEAAPVIGSRGPMAR